MLLRFVVSSESPGYGPNGGFDHSRWYNIPILHRTYNCRHGKTLYTFYAIGLATVAAPGIMKPGVIFPNFEATGRHTAHNPTRLILEESANLWPGLRISCLLRYVYMDVRSAFPVLNMRLLIYW